MSFLLNFILAFSCHSDSQPSIRDPNNPPNGDTTATEISNYYAGSAVLQTEAVCTDSHIGDKSESEADDSIVHCNADSIVRYNECSVAELGKRGVFPRTDTVVSQTATLVEPPPRARWWTAIKNLLYPPDVPGTTAPTYRYAPIISGLIIPFAILLEVPGLVSHWYIRTEADKIVETRANPPILDIGLAISASCGVIATASLIVRFLEIRVKFATIVCVVFLSIHDIINAIAVSSFGVAHRFDDGFTYGQAFWLTLCSTIASLITNFTLLWDLIRTSNFSEKGSGLTRKQRSLTIIVIVLLCYIAFGALVHSFLIKLSFVDALYFTVASIETIGFGDISPPTFSARIFTCIYVFVGVINIALTVGLARESVLEALEVGSRKRLEDIRERMKKVKRNRKISERWREAIEWRLRETGLRTWINNDDRHSSKYSLAIFHPITSFIKRMFAYLGVGTSGSLRRIMENQYPRGMKLNLEALTRAQLGAAALEAGIPLGALLPPGFKAADEIDDPSSSNIRRWWRGVLASHPSVDLERGLAGHYRTADNGATQAHLGAMVSMLGAFAVTMNTTASPTTPRTLRGRRRKSMTEMLYEEEDDDRSFVENEEKRAFFIRLALCWTVFLVFWMSGSAVFSRAEGWSFGVSMYFCFVSFATIGYGDYSPHTPAGRSIFVVWALLGVAAMTVLFAVMSEAYTDQYKNAMSTIGFSQAVKRYRRRRSRSRTIGSVSGLNQTINVETNKTPAHSCISCLPSAGSSTQQSHENDEALSSSRHRVTERLHSLPHEVLKHAHAFHEHIKYFNSEQKRSKVDSMVDDASDNKIGVPNGIMLLLDEVAGGAETLGIRIKEEILQDKDARKTLFTLSLEESLLNIITVAERAILTLEEHESLLEKQALFGSEEGKTISA